MLSIYLTLTIFSIFVLTLPFLLNLKVRKRIDKRWYIGLTISSLLIIFALWFIATNGSVEERMVNPIILPAPVEVVQAFPTLHFNQGLVRNVITSFNRVCLGFTLAVIFCFGVGIAMAAFTPVYAFFRPVQTATSYVPTISFIPLTLAWWGIDETQKIGFLFIACTIALLPIVINSINGVCKSYLDVARTKGASEYQLLRHVLIPIAAPQIWDGMRIVFGIGWTWIILVEMMNANAGIGYLIGLSEKRGNVDSVFALILVIILIAMTCDYIWRSVGAQLFKWKKVV